MKRNGLYKIVGLHKNDAYAEDGMADTLIGTVINCKNMEVQTKIEHKKGQLKYWFGVAQPKPPIGLRTAYYFYGVQLKKVKD